VFQQRCARCHGADGSGEPRRRRLPEIPDFRNPRWQASRSDEQLRTSIRDGKEDQMPAFGGRVSDDQVRQLVAQVRAFGRPAGEPAASGSAQRAPEDHGGSTPAGSRPPGSGTGGGGKLTSWLANFHPPAVSFPIALLVAAAAAEVLLLVTRRPLFDAAARFCLWFAAFAAVPAALLGWCCGGFHLRDPDWVLAVHRWLGTATALGTLSVLVLSEVGRRQGGGLRIGSRILVVVAAGLILVTGFFGGAVVHGLNHYAWPP
jgi:uncharacterized membrane protein